jgi:internalin A
LRHLTNAVDLRLLELNRSQVTGSGFDYLVGMKNLTQLVLSNTPTCSGLESIASLPKLRELRLSESAITVESLRPLASSNSLVYIQLEGTQVTDKGLMSLAKIPSLRRVNVDGSKVTPEGIAAFQAICPDVEIK